MVTAANMLAIAMVRLSVMRRRVGVSVLQVIKDSTVRKVRGSFYSLIRCSSDKTLFFPLLLSECEQGTFGPECSQVCDCDGVTPCDPVTGKCLCGPGKMGSRCDTSTVGHLKILSVA